MTERSVSVKTERRTICRTVELLEPFRPNPPVYYNTEDTVKRETAKLAYVTSVMKNGKRSGREKVGDEQTEKLHQPPNTSSLRHRFLSVYEVYSSCQNVMADRRHRDAACGRRTFP